MISQAQLEQLLEFRNEEALITSCYLNLDRGQMPAPILKLRLKDLLQAAHHELAAKTATHAQRESLRADFSRIDALVMRAIAETRHRGVAVFSCAARKFWQTYGLPRMVRNILVADHAPYVRPLTALLAGYRRFGVVLVDQTQGRLFEVYMGEITEHARRTDPVPRRVREGGIGGRDERHIERHHTESVQQHLQRVADAAFALFHERRFDALVAGGARDMVREFKQHLHPYLKERWAGEFPADAARATAAEVLAETMKIEQEANRQHDRRVTGELVRQAQAGRLAVTGLAATVDALRRGAAQTVLVEDGWEQAGYVCGACQYVGLAAGDCPQCGRPLAPCPDVVEEMVAIALQKGCRVEHVQPATPLEAAGRIGARLRYPVVSAA